MDMHTLLMLDRQSRYVRGLRDYLRELDTLALMTPTFLQEPVVSLSGGLHPSRYGRVGHATERPWRGLDIPEPPPEPCYRVLPDGTREPWEPPARERSTSKRPTRTAPPAPDVTRFRSTVGSIGDPDAAGWE